MKPEIKLSIIFILAIILFYVLPSIVQAEELSSEYVPYIQEMSAIHDFSFQIALAVAIVESKIQMVVSTENWNGSKDVGVFQLNDRYHDYFEKNFWYKDRIFNPYNPEDNIEMGIILLKHLYDATGSYDKAVIAFHIGLRGLKHNPDKGRTYLNQVINVLSTLEIK